MKEAISIVYEKIVYIVNEYMEDGVKLYHCVFDISSGNGEFVTHTEEELMFV